MITDLNNLQAKLNRDNSIFFNWDAIESSIDVGYTIERRLEGEADYTLLGTTTNTCYLDRSINIQDNSTASYRINDVPFSVVLDSTVKEIIIISTNKLDMLKAFGTIPTEKSKSTKEKANYGADVLSVAMYNEYIFTIGELENISTHMSWLNSALTDAVLYFNECQYMNILKNIKKVTTNMPKINVPTTLSASDAMVSLDMLTNGNSNTDILSYVSEPLVSSFISIANDIENGEKTMEDVVEMPGIIQSTMNTNLNNITKTSVENIITYWQNLEDTVLEPLFEYEDFAKTFDIMEKINKLEKIEQYLMSPITYKKPIIFFLYENTEVINSRYYRTLFKITNDNTPKLTEFTSDVEKIKQILDIQTRYKEAMY